MVCVLDGVILPQEAVAIQNASQKMDYSKLPLSDLQIRLLTIQPRNLLNPDRRIRCQMEVREKPLPMSATVADSGMVPSNYISFDHYLNGLEEECFGAALRRDVTKIEKKLEKTPNLIHWAAEKATKLLKRAGLEKTPRGDLLIPVDDIVNLLTRDDWISMSQDIGKGFDMSITGPPGPGPKRCGILPLKDLNPFFRTPQPVSKSVDPDNYVALSYAWGPESPTFPIFINDQLVEVRQNLGLALQRFQTMDYFLNGGKIWIDALCINQDDEEEKQVQIANMSMIYNLAGNIIVWLGPEGGGSDMVIEYLEQWSKYYRIEYIEAVDGSDPLTATTWRNMAQLRLRTANRQALALQRQAKLDLTNREALYFYWFFERSYWRRLWIIQELAMGRPGMPIVCGNRVTQWRYIRDGLLFHVPIFGRIRAAAQTELTGENSEYYSGVGDLPKDDPLQHVSQIAQLEICGHRRRLPQVDKNALPIYTPAIVRDGPLHGSSLRQALLLSSRALCFKPHDRVYGMLSIPGLPRFEIEPNYSKPVGEVFMEFTAACVKNMSLDFFSLIDGIGMLPTGEDSVSLDDCMPSWVPNYAAHPERKIGLIDGDWKAGGETGGRFPFFLSFATLGFCAPPSVEGRELTCSGRVVEEIDGIGAVSKADLDTGTLAVLDPELFAVKQPCTLGDKSEAIEQSLKRVLGTSCGFLRTEVPGTKLHKALSKSRLMLTLIFPESEPLKEAATYRNWHFLNSSANLIIHGCSLSQYIADSKTTDGWDKTIPPDLLGKQTLKNEKLQVVEARTKMRRLIVTKSGLPGLAPVTTEVGDFVLVIVGYGRPLIAKPVMADGKRVWQLRGEAYVDGMMKMEKMPLNTMKPELMIEETKDLGLEQLSFV